jgi:beta-lactamase class C
MGKRIVHLSVILLLFLAIVSLNRSLIQVGARNHGNNIFEPVAANGASSDFDSLVSCYDKFFYAKFKEDNCPGAAVAIVKDSGIKWLKGYGVKESGTQDSVDINTVFRVGSVSKGFAAVIAGIHINENNFTWDDRVKDHLSDFRLKDSVNTYDLTIRHILSHTTGLPKHTYTNLLDQDVSYEEIIKLIDDVPAISPPGKVYSYQNVMYSLIGNILRNTTGKCYNSLIAERIFEPLEMHDSSIDYFSLAESSNLARPHYKTNKGYRPRNISNKYFSVSPASGISTSISDMSKWMEALLGRNPDVISPDILNEIFKPHIKTHIKYKYRKYWKDLGELYYGLGWRIFNYRGNEIIYHGGYINGYRAEVALYPEKGIGIAVFMNSSSELSNMCIPQFFDIYFEKAI